MIGSDKVVARFKDGRVLKGHVSDFDPDAVEIILIELENGKELRLSIDELKALFFVHSLEGDRNYRERKVFGISESIGHKDLYQISRWGIIARVCQRRRPLGKGLLPLQPGKKLQRFFHGAGGQRKQ